MYQFRSLQDLNSSIDQALYRIPTAVDLVVGVPRSGLLAANLIALKLNRPLTDLDGLCNGRIMASGLRGRHLKTSNFHKILIVDDSLNSGESLQKARATVAQAALAGTEVLYCIVYVVPGKENLVDVGLDLCPKPRVFEWNIMHHDVLENACVDIDGVLCRDPTPEENDDGPAYGHFLSNVNASQRPTRKIAKLVTCRLEKYRQQTEEWLTKNGINWSELVMLDMSSGEERRKWGKHGEFKGQVYKASGCELFIESDMQQALKIADTSGRSVLAWDEKKMVYPSSRAMVELFAKKVPKVLMKRAQGISTPIGRWLADKLRY